MEIAEQFNDYFATIDHLISNSYNINNATNVNPNSYLKHAISDTIVLDPPTPAEIFNEIHSLNPSKADGNDNVSTFFLQMTNEIIAPKYQNTLK